MRLFAISFIASTALVCPAQTARTKQTLRTLSITISAAGWGDDTSIYPEGKPISIRCSFKNTGRQSLSLDLKDHDAYHGTLAYPLGVQAKVADSSGKVISLNEIDRSGEGWWSQYYLWSTTFEPWMPGDTISLPPKKEVIRDIPLNQVLSMCPGLRSGLPQGSYTIQLRFKGVLSNSLAIKIGPPK